MDKKNIKIAIIHIVCLLFVVIAAINVNLSHRDFICGEADFDDGNLSDWSTGWTINYGGNIIEDVTLPQKLPVEKGERVILRKTLPDKIKEYNCLMLEGTRQDITVSIGGIQRASFSNEKYRRWGKTSPSGVVIVPLYNTDSLEDIAISISSDSVYSGNLGRVYLGDEKSLVVLMVKTNLMWILLTLLVFIVGIVCLVCYFLFSFEFSVGKSMLYLAMFSFLSTAWSLSQSGVRQFFVNDLTSLEAAGSIFFLLLPIPVILFTNGIFNHKYKVITTVCLALVIIDFCTQISLQTFFEIGTFEMKEVTLFLFYFIIIVCVAICIIEIKREADKKYFIILGGLICLFLSNLSEALFINYRRLMESYNRSSIGVLIFICCGFVYTFKLVNEQKQKKKDIEKANLAKTLFLATMSHEIKTPINAILGMNEMVMRDTSEDVIREYSAGIDSSGKRLLALVNDILDFSMIEAGKADIKESDYKLKPVLMDLVTNTETFIGDRNLKVVLDIDESIPCEYSGDAVRIKQVLANLLSNATKFTKEGTITLTVKNYGMSEGKDNIYFAVKDTGVGIKPEDVERLMDPFVRMDEVKNSSIEGTGLGLAITKELLSLMDSKLEVTSEFGKGSEFSFILPQRIIDASPIGSLVVHTEPVEKKRKITFIAPDAKVLAVDDNKMNLKVLAGILKATKVEVTTCLSGQEGLDLCKDNCYDLIFMDHMMPEMDGIETFKRLREDKSLSSTDSPVVVLTANTVSGAREMYMECGFDYYLKKPIEVSELNEVMQKYLPSEKILPFEE